MLKKETRDYIDKNQIIDVKTFLEFEGGDSCLKFIKNDVIQMLFGYVCPNANYIPKERYTSLDELINANQQSIDENFDDDGEGLLAHIFIELTKGKNY